MPQTWRTSHLCLLPAGTG